MSALVEESRVLDEPRLYVPTAVEQVGRLHAMEFADDWQYATVWRMARSGQRWTTLGPPPGVGWEINSNYQGGVKQQIVPVWSDGSIVMQLTPWRRRVVGMRPWHLKQTVYERVQWGGDPRP